MKKDKDLSIFTPTNDTLITMARLVYEKSELFSFVTMSFSIEESLTVEGEKTLVVRTHDDKAGTSEIDERVSVVNLVASYIGLGLDASLGLDANDAVTTGHRLGNTGRPKNNT